MKHRKITAPLTIGLLLISLTYIPAATRYWDGGDVDITDLGDGFSTGGSGTWNTTLLNWDPGAGEAHVAWNNASGDTASLGGASGDLIDLGAPISAGTLSIIAPVILDLHAENLTLTATTAAITGSAAATIKSTEGSGKIIVGANQSWSNTTGILTVSCPVDTGTNLLNLIPGNNLLDVAGIISGTGGLQVTSSVTSGTTPNSSGTPTLNNLNDYTGTTTVSGWIWLNSGGVSAFGPDPSNLIFNSGGVRLTGTGTIDRGITVSGTSGISKVSGTTTVNGKISGTGNLQISANFGTTSPVVLAAVNDFTGDCLTGPDGIVRLAHADAVATANLAWADNNGRSIHDLATNNLAYVIGGLKSVGNKSNNLNLGTATASGGSGLVSFGANGQSNTYTGILSGAAGFKKVGAGTQTLIGDNTYTGNTVIAEGTLKLGRIAGQTGVSCTTGASGSNVKRLTVPSSANLYIGQAVTGTLIGANARITNINTTTQVTLSVDNTTPSSSTTVDFADLVGSLIASPVIEVQTGATFDVSAYPWTLDAAQTLGGSGTVVGAMTAAGTLAPGLANIGTLTTGDLTLTGSYACDLDGTSADRIVAGALTLSGAKITFNPINPPTAQSYVIATYTGAAPAPFITDASLPSGYSLNYDTPGEIRLVGGATPPPYDQWAFQAGLTAGNKGKDQDPDGDGVKNLLEFALGGNPLSGSDRGPSVAKVQDVAGSPALTLTIATRAGTSFDTGTGARTATKDGVSYRIEGGQNLVDWTTTISEVSPALTTGLPTAPAGYEYHTFKTAGPIGPTPADFIRVRVSE